MEKQSDIIKSASQEISQQFRSLMNAEHVESLKTTQDLILGRLQDSNAVLSHFNEYSEQCYAEVSGEFSRNTRLLKSMKTDLNYIFSKLRTMKAKLLEVYPDAFSDGSTYEAPDERPDLEKPVRSL